MYGSHLWVFIVLFLISVLTGCGTDFDGTEDDFKEIIPEEFNFSTLCESGFKSRFEPLSLPNHYRVSLQLEAILSESHKFLLETKEGDPIEIASTEIDDSQIDLKDGNSIQVTLIDETGSGTLTVCRTEIMPPKDIIIGSQENLDSHFDQKIEIETDGRIFFISKKPFYLNNRDVFLKANTIISRETVFKTFQNPNEEGIQGQSAPNFQITAQKLEGVLTIELNGQKGGQGSTGKPRRKGSTGDPGPSWSHHWFKLGETDICYVKSVNGTPSESKPKISQANHPLNGRKGKQGDPGEQGGKGAPGGSGGDLLLNIEDLDLSQIQYDLSGGNGGLGGIGGSGGPGGDGGHPGTLQGWDNGVCQSIGPVVSCCPPPIQGPQGETGSQGPMGPVGEKGSSGSLFLNGVRVDE